MDFVTVSREARIATVALSRGKVNALNERVLDELFQAFRELEADRSVRGVVLTGGGPFFSFGFDLPELFPLAPEAFGKFLEKFCSLYTYLFVFPKPLIGAVNGHAVAGGCMLALTCDYRILASEKAKVGLNEIAFGSTVPSGSVHMLRFCCGEKHAQTVLYSGALYGPEEAFERGLVEQICAPADLMKEAKIAAERLAEKEPAAFRSVKRHLRGPVAEEMTRGEAASIREFVEIWYSDPTRSQVQQIQIRD